MPAQCPGYISRRVHERGGVLVVCRRLYPRINLFGGYALARREARNDALKSRESQANES
ncbi:hypothetical protein ABIA18_005610 [Sinorhizobium fredii]